MSLSAPISKISYKYVPKDDKLNQVIQPTKCNPSVLSYTYKRHHVIPSARNHRNKLVVYIPLLYNQCGYSILEHTLTNEIRTRTHTQKHTRHKTSTTIDMTSSTHSWLWYDIVTIWCPRFCFYKNNNNYNHLVNSTILDTAFGCRFRFRFRFITLHIIIITILISSRLCGGATKLYPRQVEHNPRFPRQPHEEVGLSHCMHRSSIWYKTNLKPAKNCHPGYRRMDS